MTENIDPRVILQQAALLERNGRLAEAEAAYVQVLSQWPDLPNTWYNLALLQRRAGRFEAALASYQQALDRGVSQPEEVHLNRGVIYSDCLRQDAAAERELAAALALNPGYVPALLNLANLKEDLGQRDHALALYERILTLQPQHHEALARYAALKGAADPGAPIIDRLRASIAHGGGKPADNASLGFALGKLLDACGAYDEAFEAYAAANRASRASAASLAPLYDRRSHELFIDQVIAAFTHDSRRSAPPAPPAGPRPIFICGMFRSGSTLIEQVLAGHSQVQAGGELPFLPSIVKTRLAPFPQSMLTVAQPEIEDLAASYLGMLSKLFPDAACVTDKRPDNFLYIGLIKTLLPNARIVHTRRNPLDNCLSIFFLHLAHTMGYALDLMDTAHHYAQYRRLMAHWKSLYGADILDVDYDAFVSEPRPLVERLLAFCGLEWEENCMAFQHVRNAVKTASVWQVRQPLYRHSSGRWRNYAIQLEPVRRYLGVME